MTIQMKAIEQYFYAVLFVSMKFEIVSWFCTWILLREKGLKKTVITSECQPTFLTLFLKYNSEASTFSGSSKFNKSYK